MAAVRYVIFHKPYGVVSQFSGEGPTLAAYIPVPGVYPVGRLDRDSEGLMLLTDDGPLQNRLTDPRHAHPRTYWVQVEGMPDAPALRKLEAGVELQSHVTRPARVRLLDAEPTVTPRDPPIRFRKAIPTSWMEITLIEGKNRQIRRMTAAVGYPTLRLIRVAIGNLRLEGLAPGEWRNVTLADVKR